MNKLIYLVSLCFVLNVVGCSCEREGKDGDDNASVQRMRAARAKKREKKKREQAALRKRVKKLDETKDINKLLAALSDKNGDYRAAAIRNIGNQKPEVLSERKVLEALVPMLVDEHGGVRRRTLRIIVETGNPAVPVLVDAIREDHPKADVSFKNGKNRLRLKDMVQVAFSKMEKFDIEPLVVALKTGDRMQKVGVARALARIGDDAKSTVPIMIEQMNDEDWLIRRDMINRAFKIDPTNPDLKKAVEKAKTDEDERVRKTAERVLEQLANGAETKTAAAATPAAE